MEFDVKPRPVETDRKNPFKLFIGIIVFLLVMFALKFDDVVEYKEGKWRLKQWRIDQIQKQLEEMDDSEQYVLRCMEDGFYECYACKKGVSYMYKNEIWKVGVSQKGDLRYKDEYYNRMDLYYVAEYKGDIGTCLKKEKIRLAKYPLLPENLKRKHEDRLALPPGNKLTR